MPRGIKMDKGPINKLIGNQKIPVQKREKREKRKRRREKEKENK
jgi:Zn-finger nucleic acid-binding protein